MMRLIGTLAALLTCRGHGWGRRQSGLGLSGDHRSPEPLQQHDPEAGAGQLQEIQPRLRSTIRSIRRTGFRTSIRRWPEIVGAWAGSDRPAAPARNAILPSGDGHPESASLAGLNANYIVRQMAAFKNGERKGVRAGVMIAMGEGAHRCRGQKRPPTIFASLKAHAGLQTRSWRRNKSAGDLCRPGRHAICAVRRHFRAGRQSHHHVCHRTPNAPRCATPENLDLRTFVARGSIAKGAALAAGGDGKNRGLHHLSWGLISKV